MASHRQFAKDQASSESQNIESRLKTSTARLEAGNLVHDDGIGPLCVNRNSYVTTEMWSGVRTQPWTEWSHVAAAQNVRSGSSPVPTHDPDLRSRPPIQTSDPDLSKGFDPDLWNDIMYWWVDVWSSDGCMLLGFLLCSYSPCQAAKQQTVVKPRCQAVTLRSCTCRKVTLLSSPAAKLQLLHIQAAKLPSWHCWASLPSSQAAHLLPAHLVVLFLSCCIQAATYTSMWVHFWADPDPDPDRSRPDPDHNHNQLRPRPHPAPC